MTYNNADYLDRLGNVLRLLEDYLSDCEKSSNCLEKYEDSMLGVSIGEVDDDDDDDEGLREAGPQSTQLIPEIMSFAVPIVADLAVDLITPFTSKRKKREKEEKEREERERELLLGMPPGYPFAPYAYPPGVPQMRPLPGVPPMRSPPGLPPPSPTKDSGSKDPTEDTAESKPYMDPYQFYYMQPPYLGAYPPPNFQGATPPGSRGASPSPTKSSPSPTRASPSPTRASPSPTRSSPSPTRSSPSPTKASPSPTKAQPLHTKAMTQGGYQGEYYPSSTQQTRFQAPYPLGPQETSSQESSDASISSPTRGSPSPTKATRQGPPQGTKSSPPIRDELEYQELPQFEKQQQGAPEVTTLFDPETQTSPQKTMRRPKLGIRPRKVPEVPTRTSSTVKDKQASQLKSNVDQLYDDIMRIEKRINQTIDEIINAGDGC